MNYKAFHWHAAFLFAWALIGYGSGPASAHGAAGPADSIEQKIQPPGENTENGKIDFFKLGEDGLSLRSGDGDHELRLGGVLQGDGHFFTGLSPDGDEFVMRRIRPVLQGQIARNFSFMAALEFGVPAARVFDAYVDYNAAPGFNLRVGKSRFPLAMERFQFSPDIRFIERSLADNLVPTRDVGVDVYGSLSAFALQYRFGVTNGVQDRGNENSDSNSDKTFSWRVFAEPFRNAAPVFLRGFGAGFGGSWTAMGYATLPAHITPGRITFFRYRKTTESAGMHRRLAPHFFYHHGPLGVTGEWVLSSQELAAGDIRTTLHNRAWQLAASYLLTGENASVARITPNRRFDWKNGGWGAFEAVARLHELRVDGRAFPLFANSTDAAAKAAAFDIGLNWYLNRNLKMILEYEQTWFSGGAPDGANRPAEKAVLSRLQAAF